MGLLLDHKNLIIIHHCIAASMNTRIRVCTFHEWTTPQRNSFMHTYRGVGVNDISSCTNVYAH